MNVRGTMGDGKTLIRLSPTGDFSQSVIDPQGRQVAFWGQLEGTTGRHLWVADVNTGECRQITKNRGLHGHPAWWPDSNSLVYFSTDGASGAVDWHPQRQFSIDRSAANLFVIDIRSGERRQLTHGDYVDERPSISPDGKYVIFVSNRSGQLNLWSLELASGELQLLTGNSKLDYRPAFSPCGRLVAYFTLEDDQSHQLALLRWPSLAKVEISTAEHFRWAHGPFWCSSSEILGFHGLHRAEKQPALWQLDIKSGAVGRFQLPGIRDCSHGSLDKRGRMLAFDSRIDYCV